MNKTIQLTLTYHDTYITSTLSSWLSMWYIRSADSVTSIFSLGRPCLCPSFRNLLSSLLCTVDYSCYCHLHGPMQLLHISSITYEPYFTTALTTTSLKCITANRSAQIFLTLWAHWSPQNVNYSVNYQRRENAILLVSQRMQAPHCLTPSTLQYTS
jgi:hypothetical protein